MDIRRIHMFCHLVSTRRIIGNRFYLTIPEKRECRDYVILYTSDKMNIHITPEVSHIVEAEELRDEFRSDFRGIKKVKEVKIHIPVGHCLVINLDKKPVSVKKPGEDENALNVYTVDESKV